MAQEDRSERLHGATQPRFGEVHIRNRGHLPHWEKDSGLYFITFHLADSLPKPVLEKIAERHRILKAAQQIGATVLPEQKRILAEYSHSRIEEYYDRLIREQEELGRAMKYVLENPIKAGLKNWPWKWSASWEARATAGREAGATNSQSLDTISA